MSRDPLAWLHDIEMECRYIEGFIARTRFDDYREDRDKRYILERALGKVGEALNQIKKSDEDLAKTVSTQLVERFPAMQNTIRVRNILTHAYHRYLDDTVWDAANNSIPALHRVVSDLLSELSPAGPPALHEAVKMGHPDQVRQLIKEGADVNALNDKGWTPLHIAGHRAAPDLVQVLLAAQAHPHSPGPDKTTPLHWAVRRKAPADASAIVLALLDHGADPALRDDQGRTALMIGMTNPALAGTEGLTRLREVSPPPPAAQKPEDSGSSFTP